MLRSPPSPHPFASPPLASKIGDEVPSRSADKPSRYVFMIGDGKPKIKVNYYIEAHPVVSSAFALPLTLTHTRAPSHGLC